MAPASRAALPAAAPQEQLRQRPATAAEAAQSALGPGPAAPATSPQEPPATIPTTAPSLSPPPLEAPVPGPVGVPVPNLQPPVALPPAVTQPLDALTGVLSGATAALP